MEKESVGGKSAFAHIKIKQFAPTGKGEDLGAYGWGFDVGGFRVVMYCPSEADTVEVKDAAKKLAASDYHRRAKKRMVLSKVAEGDESIPTSAKNRHELEVPVLEKPEKKLHQSDHPPAHVHVISLKPEQTSFPRVRLSAGKRIYDTIYKENRYELIAAEDGGYRALLMTPHVNEDGSMSKRAKEQLRTMIDVKHEPEIQVLLDAMAPELVECWRKLYSPEAYTAEQIARNPTLALGFDQYVSQDVDIETRGGRRSFIRRLEGPDKISYTDGENMRLRVVFPPADDECSL